MWPILPSIDANDSRLPLSLPSLRAPWCAFYAVPGVLTPSWRGTSPLASVWKCGRFEDRAWRVNTEEQRLEKASNARPNIFHLILIVR